MVVIYEWWLKMMMMIMKKARNKLRENELNEQKVKKIEGR